MWMWSGASVAHLPTVQEDLGLMPAILGLVIILRKKKKNFKVFPDSQYFPDRQYFPDSQWGFHYASYSGTCNYF